MISSYFSSLGLGVNPYCTGEIDFPMTKKSAASTDRQPYSLCSNRKSLSQQLDCPAGKAVVRRKGGEPGSWEEREGPTLAVAEKVFPVVLCPMSCPEKDFESH